MALGHIYWPDAEIVLVEPGNPAVGVGYLYTVPTGYIEIVEAVRLTFDTDANVANRNLTFRYKKSDGTTWGLWIVDTAQTAGQTKTYSGHIGFARNSWGMVGNDLFGCFPGRYLLSSEKFNLDFVNIQAGDQISNIFLRIRRWRAT